MKLWQPWLSSNFENPYPMYAALREQDPVHYAQTGEWIITRYEDIRTVLKNNRVQVGNRLEWMKRGIDHLNNRDMDYQAITIAISKFILFLNPPEHTRIRKFVNTVWTDYNLEPVIKACTRELIDQLPDRFDLAKDYAQVVPVLVMSRLLGIPASDYLHLNQVSLNLVKVMDLYISVKDLVTIHEAAVEFIDYFKKAIKENRLDKAGLMHKIIDENAVSKDPLSANEIISLCIFLFSAGEETTSGFISTGTRNLIKVRDQFPHTELDWHLAIDELLRFEPPVQLLGRIAGEDMLIGERKIPEGSTLTLCLGSANRDELVFDNPNEINLQRTQNRHMAFGTGIHFCMGDWLGKLQGRIALQTLFTKFPNLVPDGSVQWNKHLSIRSMSSFPVRTN